MKTIGKPSGAGPTPAPEVVVTRPAPRGAGPAARAERPTPIAPESLPSGVQRRGDGQYRARKVLDGVRFGRTFATARDAEDWLKAVEVDHRRGVFQDRREAERTTLGEILKRYATEQLGDGSEKLGAIEERTGHLPTVLADPVCRVTMANLQKTHVAAFRDRMARAGYAKGTIVRRLNLLATIIGHAMREWGINIASNPATAGVVRRPRFADRKRERCLVGDEEARLVAAAERSRHRWDAPLIRWGIAQGMRLGESTALIWEDLDEERRTVRVYGRHRRGTKGGERVEVRPLMPEALEILRHLPRGGAKDRVFPTDPKAFTVRFRRLVQALGVADLRYHDLRHEATTRLARRFPNPLDLMRVTGHKDLKSLRRYYNVDAAELAARAAEGAPSAGCRTGARARRFHSVAVPRPRGAGGPQRGAPALPHCARGGRTLWTTAAVMSPTLTPRVRLAWRASCLFFPLTTSTHPAGACGRRSGSSPASLGPARRASGRCAGAARPNAGGPLGMSGRGATFTSSWPPPCAALSRRLAGR
ncbi:tyrosine-type recombinase/integrase [Azospirillum sp.]|uniref:tyrosine-type recombinase/integrase n=1 Tax=Azospirillum sp. TaxID=34012 RepID=UPI003D743EDD